MQDRELYGPDPTPQLTWNDVHVLVTALDHYAAHLEDTDDLVDDDLGYAAVAATRRNLAAA